MKKCSKCNLEYNNDVNFCKKCGIELDYFESKDEKAKKEISRNKKKKIWTIIRYIVGISVILGCISDADGFGVHSVFGILFGISLLPFVFRFIFNMNSLKNSKSIIKLRVALQIIIPVVFGIIWGSLAPSESLKEIYIYDDGYIIPVNESYKIHFETNLLKTRNKDLKFISSNPEIATVDNGIIKGKSVGKVTITIKGKNSVKETADYNIKYVDIEKIDFEGDLNIIVGKTGKIKIKTTPDLVSDKIVNWESSNPDIVSVDGKGNIKANSKGDVIITLTSDKGNKYTTQVKSLIELTSLELSSTSLKIEKGKSAALSFKATPEDVRASDVMWISSDSQVASVENGVVTGHSEGTATITVKSINGIEAKANVEVYEVKPESIQLNKDKLILNVGQTYKLTAKVLPTNASNKSVSWSSSNNTALAVDNGVITAKNIGKGSITAKTSNGKIQSVEVTVKKKAPIKINRFRYTKDSVCGVQWTFSITNNSKKTINYITMKWFNLNSVGDFAADEITGKYYTQLRYTGPLKPGRNSGRRQNVTKFYNCSYKSSAFTEFVIEYADGTSETINSNNMQYYQNLY